MDYSRIELRDNQESRILSRIDSVINAHHNVLFAMNVPENVAAKAIEYSERNSDQTSPNSVTFKASPYTPAQDQASEKAAYHNPTNAREAVSDAYQYGVEADTREL